ncbi:aldo/keto reductase [Lacticaseibacillus hulanensis]|uniref:aldo/keto reductase n=1 Tax=Lacticaseibacillus hulanensis TaxID=2493111 RepID=UPI000FD78E95|nr:aldo/keto reductase [Lacticaseibacillus hulanensis]
MTQVQIGKSDVYTTPLGLGTNKVGGVSRAGVDQEQSGREVIRTALSNGIQLLDTAYMYGQGRSEAVIGEVLKDFDRSKVVIATKAAHDPKRDMQPNNDPAFLRQSVDDALRRLQTDYIDIFYIHFPDATTPKAEAVGALADLKKAGKIRAIGVSNFTLDQIKEANVNGDVDVVEDHYSLVHRDPEREEMAYLKANHISFVPYFPLASGLLTGKYGENDRARFARFAEGKQFDAALAGVDVLKRVAQKHNASVTQTALAWYLQAPGVDVVIPGARNKQQVQGIVAARDVQLSQDEWQEIDAAFASFK